MRGRWTGGPGTACARRGQPLLRRLPRRGRRPCVRDGEPRPRPSGAERRWRCTCRDGEEGTGAEAAEARGEREPAWKSHRSLRGVTWGRPELGIKWEVKLVQCRHSKFLPQAVAMAMKTGDGGKRRQGGRTLGIWQWTSHGGGRRSYGGDRQQSRSQACRPRDSEDAVIVKGR